MIQDFNYVTSETLSTNSNEKKLAYRSCPIISRVSIIVRGHTCYLLHETRIKINSFMLIKLFIMLVIIVLVKGKLISKIIRTTFLDDIINMESLDPNKSKDEKK